MSVIINEQEIDMVHVRYDGKSYDFNVSDLNITNQVELFNVIGVKLNLAEGSLSGFELDIKATIKTGIIHPSARFGV